MTAATGRTPDLINRKETKVNHQHGPSAETKSAPVSAIDPVCGMTVSPANAKATAEFNGHKYYFCCSHCKEKFASDPHKYLHPEPKTPTPMVQLGRAAAVYTWPMHPEVRQNGPGACPKCGMALEPLAPTAPSAPVEYTCPMHPEI